jgi:hypothetical protein
MFQDLQEHKYYVVHTIVKSTAGERLFPFTFEAKVDSFSFVESIKAGDKQVIRGFFPNDLDISISPFLHFEKTIISKDLLISDDTLLSKPTGRLTSEMIPMDFVSDLFLATPQPTSNYAEMVDLLLVEANRGFE